MWACIYTGEAVSDIIVLKQGKKYNAHPTQNKLEIVSLAEPSKSNYIIILYNYYIIMCWTVSSLVSLVNGEFPHIFQAFGHIYSYGACTFRQMTQCCLLKPYTMQCAN